MVHDLYEETILDHSKRPRNCHAMQDATRQAEGRDDDEAAAGAS